jgi:hypothetical protein
MMKAHTFKVALLSVTLALFVGMPLTSWAAGDKLPVLTAKDVKALIATAKTPEQHLRVASYFRHEAEKYEAEAKDHVEMEEAYRQNPLPKNIGGGSGPISHCEILAKSSQQMATTARELAAEHEQMAKEAKQK